MDGTIRGLTVIINGDATKLSKAMRDARAEAGMLRGQLASVGKLMEFNPGSTELVRQKQRLLGEAIAANSRAYTRYQQAHAAYSGRLSSLTEAEMAQFRKLEGEMLRNRVEFQNLTRQATAFGAAAPAGMIAAGSAARSMSEGMRTFSNYALGASAAAGLVGAYAVKAAKDYEYAFADVRKTIVATEAEYAALSDAVIEMSLVRPASAQDIAYIMSLGGQLNIATQHLEKFAGTIADLDVATNMDLESASLDVARFANITGTAQGNVDRLGATIVDLGNNSATTEADIMAMAMRIAGTGSSLGMTAAEVLGVATSLSSVGIQAEMGGNAISTIMRRIDRDVQTNSSTLDTWAATAGMSAQQFKSLWTSDVTQGLIAVIKGMGQFQDEGGSLTLLLDELDISYMRQVDTMMRMAQAGEMANSLITRSNNAFAENSALVREVSQRYETNEAKLQMMANAAQAAAIAFGNELLPSFRDVVVGATDFMQAVASLDAGTKDTIVTVGAAVVGFGLFTKAVQTGAGVVGFWINGIGSAATAVSGWSQKIAAAAAAETVLAEAQAAGTAAQAASTASKYSAAASEAALTGAKGAHTAATLANTAATGANVAATGAQVAAQGAATASSTVLTGALGRLAAALFGTQAAALGLAGVAGALLVAGIAVTATAMASAAEENREYTASSNELRDALDAAKAKYAETALSCREGSVELARAKAELDSAQAAWDNGAESVSEMSDRLRDQADAWAETREQMAQATREADSQAGSILAAADGLAEAMASMEAGPEKTATVLALVDALNEKVPELGLAYDASADALNRNVEAVQALAEAEARRAMSEQARTNYNETYAERARQMADLAEAEATLREEGIDLAAAEQGLYTSFSSANSQMEGTVKSAYQCSGETLKLIGSYRELKGSVADTEADLQRFLATMAEAASVEEAGAEAYRLMSEEGLSLSEAVDQVSGSLDKEQVAQAAQAKAEQEAIVQAQAQAEAEEELSKEIQKVADELTELSAKNSVFGAFMADSRISTEALAEAMDASGMKVSDLEKRLEEFADATANAMERIEFPDDAIDASGMMDNLETNYGIAERWGEAMTSLYDRHGGEASAAFLSYMEDMGYEYTPLVEEFAAMSDEAWDRYVEQYNENIRLGHENALIGFRDWAAQYNSENVAVTEILASVWSTVGDEAVQGFTNAIVALGPESADVLSGLAAMSETELTQYVAAWQQAGWKSKSEFLAGMAGVSSDAQAAASGAKSAVDAELAQMQAGASEKIGQVQSVIVQGVSDATGQVDAAAESGIARPLYDKLDSTASQARSKGRESALANASGISSGGPAVSGAATGLANVAAAALASRISAARTAGFNMAAGMAEGMNSGSSLVRNAAASLVAAAETATRKTARINSPSKLFRDLYESIPEGGAQGIERGTWRVARAMESLVKSAARVPVAPAMASLSAAPAGAWDALALSDPAVQASAARRSGEGAATVVNNQSTTVVNGVTYDDGTAVYDAVGRVFRAAKIKRRMR